MSVWRGLSEAGLEIAYPIVPVIKSKLYEYKVSLDHESHPLRIYVPFSGPSLPLQLSYLPSGAESKFRQASVPDFYLRVASRKPKFLHGGITYRSIDTYDYLKWCCLYILLLCDRGRMRFLLIMNDELCHEAVVSSFKVRGAFKF